jgi:hypothetical protein
VYVPEEERIPQSEAKKIVIAASRTRTYISSNPSKNSQPVLW